MSSIKDYRGDKPSASASERWINCSASHLRCLAMPEETSASAERGTYLHKCCELYFTDFEAFQVMSKDLPRDEFDAVMFERITGIKPETKPETIRIGDYEYNKADVESRLKGIRPIA